MENFETDVKILLKLLQVYIFVHS